MLRRTDSPWRNGGFLGFRGSLGSAVPFGSAGFWFWFLEVPRVRGSDGTRRTRTRNPGTRTRTPGTRRTPEPPEPREPKEPYATATEIRDAYRHVVARRCDCDSKPVATIQRARRRWTRGGHGAAARVGREQERRVEDRDPRPWVVVAGDPWRPDLADDRDERRARVVRHRRGQGDGDDSPRPRAVRGRDAAVRASVQQLRVAHAGR
jgi:hypothetical protein